MKAEPAEPAVPAVPAAELRHMVPGRIRMHVPSLQDDLDAMRELGADIMGVPGVREVKYNPVTGSITIRHDTSGPGVLSALEEEGVLAPHPITETENFTAGAESIGRDITAARPRRIGGLLLFGLAIYQARRGKLLPSSLSLFEQGLISLVPTSIPKIPAD